MKKFLLLFVILFVGTQVFAYQNPYQNMWFDGVWRKDCDFNIKLQQCESQSINFNNYKEYNDYPNGINGYYCKNGYLYRAMGFSQRLILQTNNSGMPLGCSLKEAYSYKESQWYQKKNKIKNKE